MQPHPMHSFLQATGMQLHHGTQHFSKNRLQADSDKTVSGMVVDGHKSLVQAPAMIVNGRQQFALVACD